MMQYEIMYFSDPMCSWCYGFAPEIEKLAAEYRTRMPVQMILGGLRADEERPLPESMAAEIAHHWEMVKEASGRNFDFEFFKKHPGFVYNTAPACRAVVAAARLAEPQPMQFQHRLQQAFYEEGKNPTLPETFYGVADSVGMDVGAYRELYESDETEEITRQNFALSRAFGIHGFPTVVLRQVEEEDEKHILVTRGFVKFPELHQRLEMILNREVELVPDSQS